MKWIIFLIPIFLFSAEFNLGGYLSLETRMKKEDYVFSFNESRLDLYFKGTNENFHFFTEFWVREVGLKGFKFIQDLQDFNNFSLFLELKESYINLSNFPLDFVDLRIGKQRTAWGTAYVFNPTDNLDPFDLEDIWDFERRISSFSLRMNLFIKDFTIQSVYIPFFTPSRLPEESILNKLYPSSNLVSSEEKIILLPKRNKENSIFGLRLKRNILGTDLSLSYTYGRNFLPFPRLAKVFPTDSGIHLRTELVYPRQQIIGFDFATSFNKFGIWGEFGYFIPESLTMRIDRTLLGFGYYDSLILDKNYYKFVMGMDYRQNDNLYFLIQYVYGFPYDAGENINDFLLFHSSIKFFDNRIELKMNYAFELCNIEDKEFSHLLSPELGIYPISNLQIKAGLRYIYGDYGNFGKMKDDENIYLVFKYNY